MRNQEATTIAKHLTDYTLRFGSPRRLLSDQGTQFQSNLVREVCKVMGIQQQRSSSYHPSSNGQVEVCNRTIKNMIAKFINQETQADWDTWLQSVVFAINCSPNDSSQLSPYFLTFGHPPNLGVDVLLDNAPTFKGKEEYAIRLSRELRKAYSYAKKNMYRAKQQSKDYREKKFPVTEGFTVGQLVWLHNKACPTGLSRKLMNPWYGPYTIVAKTGPVNYAIRLFDGSSLTKIVHQDRLKPVKGDQTERLTLAREPQGEGLAPLDPDALYVQTTAANPRNQAEGPCTRSRTLANRPPSPLNTNRNVPESLTVIPDLQLIQAYLAEEMDRPIGRKQPVGPRTTTNNQPIVQPVAVNTPKRQRTSSPPTEDSDSDNEIPPLEDQPTLEGDFEIQNLFNVPQTEHNEDNRNQQTVSFEPTLSARTTTAREEGQNSNVQINQPELKTTRKYQRKQYETNPERLSSLRRATTEHTSNIPEPDTKSRNSKKLSSTSMLVSRHTTQRGYDSEEEEQN